MIKLECITRCLFNRQFLTYSIAAILGVMTTFSFAPYSIFPFAILMPAAFILLMTKNLPNRNFWLGFFFGLGFFGAGVRWVYYSIHDIGNVPLLGSLAITTAFIIVLSLFPAIVTYYSCRFFGYSQYALSLFAFPAIWVLSEWFRSFVFTGFPWLFLGYSQTNSPLKGFAPIFGVYGVSLAILLSSGLLVQTIIQYHKKQYHSLYKHFFTLIVIWIVGAALTHIPWTTQESKSLSIALVQGNVPQKIKWSPEHIQLSLDRYKNLSEKLFGHYDLIIWPEAAIPIPLPDSADYINTLDEKARKTHTTLLLGIPIESKRQHGYYNAIVTLGDENQVYNKRLLVPFGEYIPFSKQFASLFDFMNIPMSNMVPGNFSQAPIKINSTTILPNICYEIGFPSLAFSRDKNLGLILTITNDAWFGHSNAQAQHLQMGQMRAIEMQRPVIFASNDGITAIINQQGLINKTIQPYQVGILTGKVYPHYGLTPWMFNGSDPILFISLCLLYLAYKKKTNTKSQIIQTQTMSSDNNHLV